MEKLTCRTRCLPPFHPVCSGYQLTEHPLRDKSGQFSPQAAASSTSLTHCALRHRIRSQLWAQEQTEQLGDRKCHSLKPSVFFIDFLFYISYSKKEQNDVKIGPKGGRRERLLRNEVQDVYPTEFCPIFKGQFGSLSGSDWVTKLVSGGWAVNTSWIFF